MNRSLKRCGFALLTSAMLTTLAMGPAQGESAKPTVRELSFTTLGTNSGPIPSPLRAQPANLLRYDDQVILIDVGDGAADQLAKAGVRIGEVQTIIISHHHFDHTGGLFAFLGRRYQTRITTPLTIYGPPGTRRMVDDLFAAMRPGMEVSATIRGPAAAADNAVTVIEIGEGAQFNIGKATVTATVNSHYETLEASPSGTAEHLALSFRFDVQGRSILYTGDTGPSANVDRLCQGVDLLVSEIMDPDEAIEKIRKTRPDVPAAAWVTVAEHFRKEHLSPEEVGLLAQRCGAKALVLTHNSIDDPGLERARIAIAARYKGPITFAHDLQTF